MLRISRTGLVLAIVALIVSAGLILVIDATADAQEYDTYIVQEGDSLARIAADYGLTTQELMALNGLSSPILYRKQELKVPAQPATASETEGELSPDPTESAWVETTEEPSDVVTDTAAAEATEEPEVDTTEVATDTASAEATADVTDTTSAEATEEPEVEATEVATDTASTEATEAVTDTAAAEATEVATDTASAEASEVATDTTSAEVTEVATDTAAAEVSAGVVATPTRGTAEVEATEVITSEATEEATAEATEEATPEATPEPTEEATPASEGVPASTETPVASGVPADGAAAAAAEQAPVSAVEAWVAPESGAEIFSPVAGGAYHSPIEIAGLTGALEGEITVRLLDGGSEPFGERTVTVESPDSAGFFATSLRFTVTDPLPATLEVTAGDAEPYILPVILLPGQRFIDLDLPAGGAVVCSPVDIAGYSSTNEANVVVEITQPDGTQLAQEPTTGGSFGIFREFSIAIDLSTDEPQPLIIAAFEIDASGMYPSVDRTAVPVTLHPDGSAACE